MYENENEMHFIIISTCYIKVLVGTVLAKRN